MSYASLSKLRLLTHFSTAEISDADVASLIPEADRAILRLATIEVYDEKLDGDIDGTNTIFTTKHKPIADTDFDSDVDADDVTVYLVDYDSEMNEVHSEATVSAVNARDGIITLASAPTTTDVRVGVFADYRYYKMPVDYDVLKLAANYYLAHLCEMKIRTERALQFTTPEPGALPPLTSSKSRWLDLALSSLPFAKPSLIGV